jgi:outer membrane protein OmpA-like peptidoglycan-associated protein
MKIFLLSVFLFSFITADAQHVGPSNNVGREYGNPKMPLMVSHLAGANKARLERANGNSRHSVFGKILCFRKLCRIQSGHSASLRAISFKKHKKNVARNAKKGVYRDIQIDSSFKRKPSPPETKPVVIDSLSNPQMSLPSIAMADSLIILNAELLFEPNSAKLRSEDFITLNSIVDYLLLYPKRSVTISGHTDDRGSQAHNLTLSKQRADVVAEFLMSHRINVSRIKTFGLGSQKPIATNSTDEGRKKNRRVELLIHGN